MRGIDQATLSKMRELAAAHRPPPPAPAIPNVDFPRGIDQATLSKMRELAAAHRPPPAAPGVE